MAASGSTPIILFNSGTSGHTPTTGNLSVGELALNYADGKLYYNTGSAIAVLSTASSQVPTPFTANGVVYASSTSALTTGSALTWNGTTFALTGNGNFSGADGVFVSGAISGSSPFISGGNLELGATSSSALVQAYNRPSFGAYNLDFKTTTAFTFSLSGSEQMRLTSTGLGIGTSSPGYKLDVNGSGRFNAAGGTGVSVTGNTSANQVSDMTIIRTSSSTTIQSAPSIYLQDTGGGYYGTFQFGSGNFQFFNYGGGVWTERMRLDTSGNLGLGVTPSAWGTSAQAYYAIEGVAYGSGWLNIAAGAINTVTNAYYNASGNWIYKTSNPAARYQIVNNTHQWYNAASGTAGNAISFTAAMTLDNSGNLLVGTTSQIASGLLSLAPSSKNGMTITITSGYSGYIINNPSTAAYNGAAFQQNGSQVGVISVGTSSTAYSTSSDRRLKSNIASITTAQSGPIIDALQPRSFTWNVDGSADVGFIADEVQAVIPKAVTGAANAVDKDGKPVYQMVDMSQPELIAYLVAEIQSLRARLKAANIA